MGQVGVVIGPEAIEHVRDRIEQARIRSGRTEEPPVEIIAVTKGFPAEAVLSAYELGLCSIGENRVQEADAKFRHLPDLPRLTRRLIGHLQSNKARRAIDIFDAIDSIDSIKLGRKVSRIVEARQETIPIPILLQVNTSRDPAKFGFRPDQIEELLELVELPGLQVKGLMTVGKLTTDVTETRKAFRDLRELRDQLNCQLSIEQRLRHLSMGMTEDFEIAVEEGSSMVRLGTALFGRRPTK